MNKPKKIYIAGPMTGYEFFNFPMFDTFRDLYLKFDYQVFNPADHDRMLLGKKTDWIPSEQDSLGPWKSWRVDNAPTLRDMLGADLQWIANKATHIAMLPGWEKSSGANAEWSLAKALSLTIHYYPLPGEMLQEIRREQRGNPTLTI